MVDLTKLSVVPITVTEIIVIGVVANCPLYPQKPTWFSTILMSALCHKQTSCIVPAMVESGRKLRRGPPVREAWTNRGRVLRRLGEPNGSQDYGSHQLAAAPQPVLHGGSPKSRDPLLVFRAAYRSDTHARQATFGRLRIPLALSIVLRPERAKIGVALKTALTHGNSSERDFRRKRQTRLSNRCSRLKLGRAWRRIWRHRHESSLHAEDGSQSHRHES